MSLSNPRDKSTFVNPINVVNDYLWNTMVSIDPDLAGMYTDSGIPIKPIFPISDASSGTTMWDDKPYIIYNKVKRPSLSEVPPIKRENFIYGVKGDTAQTFEWISAITAILDRNDDAAKDINRFNATFYRSPKPVYFHSLNVYQIEATDPNAYSNKPYSMTTLLVETKYHLNQDIHSMLGTEQSLS